MGAIKTPLAFRNNHKPININIETRDDNAALLITDKTVNNTGNNKQQVGAVASKLKTFRKIEPYKGKGIREKGQYVLKKEGKKK